MNQETYDKVISLLEEMQADIKVANGKLDKIDDKLNRIDDKINRVNNELDKMNNKLDNLSKEFNEGVNRIISIGGK